MVRPPYSPFWRACPAHFAGESRRNEKGAVSAAPLQAHGGVVGAAAGDLQVAGDAGGGVASEEALPEGGEDVGVDLLVAGGGRRQGGRGHGPVLAPRPGGFDGAHGPLRWAPPPPPPPPP